MPVSLHTHSWYSLLEGVSSLEALLRRAAECGHHALALTDTNNLYGAVPFVELAHQHGVRPLLGACLRQGRQRCVALVAETAGYRSLCRIISRLHLAEPEGAADLPGLLAEHAAGLHVLADDPALAEGLREAFGTRLWLEVVRPSRSARHEQELLTAGRRLGLAPVAGTAAHFATAADYPTFRLVTAVRRLTLLDQLPARLTITPEHHLADAETLHRRFRDLPEAVANTDALAEQLRSDVLPHEVVLPRPRLPGGLEAVPYLRLLCERGLRRRDLGDSLAARQRLREELAVIEPGGLAGYFLVVRDIARHARRRGHRMALRGSAGNSLVCFLLEITDVDPLRFGLPLERFLHPGRRDLPDIDLDFDWKVRDEVLAHVFRRYGSRHTAMISTHQFLQPRSAFREAAKVHGLSNDQISRLLETLPERVEGLVEEGELQNANCKMQIANCPRAFPLEPERWGTILADAGRLLGRPHHLSIHPGGVVLTPRPVEEYVPLQRAPKRIVITQFEKDAAEQIGLVKIDLLGNRALGTVEEAQRVVVGAKPQAGRGLCPIIPPGDDPATVDLLRRGETLGVNQLESPAMRHLLLRLQPRGLDDVIQALALIRPAAGSAGMKECFIRRRRGREHAGCGYPPLDDLLRDTEGLLLYEDDALRVIHLLSGLPVPDADRLRKRIGKHRTEEEARRLAGEFRDACTRRGVPRRLAEDVWPHLARFSAYSFCRSHAVSYGLIAWTAAHLKAHQPRAFWAAALNNNQGMYPRRVYVEAVKRASIDLRLPCLNHSQEGFTVEGAALRVGLGALATLDEGLRGRLLAERARDGPYRDLADVRRRVGPGPEALAVLIRGGALDFTGRPRPALFLEAELETPGPGAGLFPSSAGPAGHGWSPPDYPAVRRLREEWAVLGFLVGPPLMALFRPRLPAGLATSRELADRVGRRVRVAGLVATARLATTAEGRSMQFVTLEDEWGLIELTLFPGACPPVAYWTLGPYLATGVVERQDEVITVRADGLGRVTR